jgi:DinB superfamily
MSPSEREHLSKHLAETRENLLCVTRGLSPTQLQYKPAQDRWSVAECLEHIAVVETLVLGNIHKTLEQADALSALAMADDAITKRVVDRSNRAKAPAPIVPTGRWSCELVLGEFEGARQRTTDFVASTDLPLRQHGFPHPRFGYLDCYQWLLLAAGHGERHRAQVEEVIADAGFPRAAAAR